MSKRERGRLYFAASFISEDNYNYVLFAELSILSKKTFVIFILHVFLRALYFVRFPGIVRSTITTARKVDNIVTKHLDIFTVLLVIKARIHNLSVCVNALYFCKCEIRVFHHSHVHISYNRCIQ